ncbi:uncharacterized protein [Oscarella lobularis]|uniref:uncharacterized protein isoform X2 n=1 Tax=Oscarella lobularis TaxID=121494 RepID=UPI003313290F
MNCSLYFGDLDRDVTEIRLRQIITRVAHVKSLKISCDRHNEQSLGYAYVNFYSHEDAECAKEKLDGCLVENRPLRVSWFEPNAYHRRSGDNNVFFGEIKSCKVVYSDSYLPLSKGFGFVDFSSHKAAEKAIRTANGKSYKGKTLYVGWHKTKNERIQEKKVQPFTNIYIANLRRGFSKRQLDKIFINFGHITSSCVNSPSEQGTCTAFVNFEDPESAAEAVERMDGGKIDGLKIYVGRAQKKAEREFVKEREKKKVTGPTNLYIKYLHEDIDDDELYSMFSSFGEIVQGGVKVQRGKRGRPTGVGFVNFVHPSSAASAIEEMNGSLDQNYGKPLYVTYHQSSEERRAKLSEMYSSAGSPSRHLDASPQSSDRHSPLAYSRATAYSYGSKFRLSKSKTSMGCQSFSVRGSRDVFFNVSSSSSLGPSSRSASRGSFNVLVSPE